MTGPPRCTAGSWPAICWDGAEHRLRHPCASETDDRGSCEIARAGFRVPALARTLGPQRQRGTGMLPLTGIKVIEIAQNLAGPFAGRILANLGADVVKLERPEGGDDARYWGALLTPDAGYTFHAMNYNKRGFALDLRNESAIDWLKTYIGECDVLVQNMRPGAMEALGLDASTLRAAYPKLVYCSLSAFGSKGPLKLKAGYEPIVQAFAGMFSINGAPDAPPTRINVPV